MEIAYLRQVLLDQQEEFESGSSFISRQVNLSPHIKSSDISVLTGVRRCGKSTLLKQIAREFPKHQIFYLDLESPRLATFQLDDFELADQIWQEQIVRKNSKDVLLLVDEVQNVDGWERWIRYFAEVRKFKVFITGSNSEMLSAELGSVLGGRYITLELFPFSIAEVVCHQLDGDSTKKPTSNRVAKLNAIIQQGFDYGMFPKPYLEQSTQIYPHLFHDIIARDIVKRKKIRHALPILELGSVLSRDNSRLVNLQSLGKVVGLEDPRTVAKYLAYFEEAYLFFRLRRFSSSLRKQLRGLSKIYCADPVLADAVSAQKPRLTVALENTVFLDLRRRQADFGYWISSNGYEVDFIVAAPGEDLVAIQVCYDLSGAVTLARELRALKAAKAELGVKTLQIVTLESSGHHKQSLVGDDITVQSLAEFLRL